MGLQLRKGMEELGLKVGGWAEDAEECEGLVETLQFPEGLTLLHQTHPNPDPSR